MSTQLSRNPSMFAGVPALAELFGDALILALEWGERVRQRHSLAGLDDRMLHDIARSRADVDGEVSKPFWRG